MARILEPTVEEQSPREGKVSVLLNRSALVREGEGGEEKLICALPISAKTREEYVNI